MTILLVDAADADTAVLASALRVEGFEAIVAKSATEARPVLSSRAVALVIIDLMLRSEGGSNGLDLAREFRHAYPTTRVLLTSSYHLSERQLERLDCGVSGFIPKPYELQEVIEFVRAKVSAPPSSRRLWCAELGSGTRARLVPSHPQAGPPMSTTRPLDSSSPDTLTAQPQNGVATRR